MRCPPYARLSFHANQVVRHGDTLSALTLVYVLPLPRTV